MKQPILEKVKHLLGIKRPPKTEAPVVTMPVTTALNTESKPEKWSAVLDRKGINIGLMECHNLTHGKAVYVDIPGEDRSGWMVMKNLRRPEMDIEIKLLGPDRNYDLQKTFAQLPLADKTPVQLEHLEYQLKRGISAKVELKLGHNLLPVRLTADPFNRSVKIEDSLGHPITLQELGIQLAPPEQTRLYALYERGKLDMVSGEYRAVLQELKNHLADDRSDRAHAHYTIVGTKASVLPEYVGGKLVENDNTQLVMTARSYTGADNQPLAEIKTFIQPADIMTPLEKDMREALKDKPFLSASGQAEAYARIQVERTKSQTQKGTLEQAKKMHLKI